MDSTDTGKVRLDIVDGNYLHSVIYTDEEIVEGDIPPVTSFLDQFSEPIPALIERKGSYSISILVQIAMMQQTKHRLKAVAYIERNHRDAIMTRIAASTYFRDVQVKSFFDKEKAIEWLAQYFPDETITTETPKAAEL
jgi:hypothetical protein